MPNIFKTILAVVFIMTASCSGAKLAYDLTITKSISGSSKGLILLIHGAAPLNKDGRIPVSDDIIYARTTMYKDLAEALNALGWDVARYSKYGVYDESINYEQYKSTDMALILKQLKEIWKKLPKDKPLVVFAASEGTLHAPQLPLNETKAVVLLGAVATNIRDIFLEQAGTEQEKIIMQGRIDNAFKMHRDEMWGKSHPAGRIVDELNLKPNWTYYEKFQDTPILILHGENDKEVGFYQSKIWKEKLPKNNITVISRPKGNHVFGIGEGFDAKYLANTIDEWLSHIEN
jgi:fermentation-respiration switch protein FrsA (DUF1100 family)